MEEASTPRLELGATPSSQGRPQSYLFDTCCFLSLARRRVSLTTLRTLPVPVTACAMTVLELAADNPGFDFIRRKRAAQAIVSVCRTVYYETPDGIISAAFGKPQPTRPHSDPFNIMRALLLADSDAAVERGVYDPNYNCMRTVSPRNIRQIKTTQDRLARRMFSGWADATRTDLRNLLDKQENTLGREQRSRIYQELKEKYSFLPQARRAILLRLATQAGVVTAEEVTQRLRARDDDALIRKVLATYDGSLDSFVTMLQAYRRYLELGGAPGRNDAFDLEFFLYLNIRRRRHTFVTQERKWLDLSKDVLPGRVISLEELVGLA